MTERRVFIGVGPGGSTSSVVWCRMWPASEETIALASMGNTLDYDGEEDFRRAREFGFAVIRKRMAAGLSGWFPR